MGDFTQPQQKYAGTGKNCNNAPCHFFIFKIHFANILRIGQISRKLPYFWTILNIFLHQQFRPIFVDQFLDDLFWSKLFLIQTFWDTKFFDTNFLGLKYIWSKNVADNPMNNLHLVPRTIWVPFKNVSFQRRIKKHLSNEILIILAQKNIRSNNF